MLRSPGSVGFLKYLVQQEDQSLLQNRVGVEAPAQTVVLFHHSADFSRIVTQVGNLPALPGGDEIIESEDFKSLGAYIGPEYVVAGHHQGAAVVYGFQKCVSETLNCRKVGDSSSATGSNPRREIYHLVPKKLSSTQNTPSDLILDDYNPWC